MITKDLAGTTFKYHWSLLFQHRATWKT